MSIILYLYIIPTTIMWIWCIIEGFVELRNNDTENFMWLVLKVIIGSIPFVNIVYILYLIKEEVEDYNERNAKHKV